MIKKRRLLGVRGRTTIWRKTTWTPWQGEDAAQKGKISPRKTMAPVWASNWKKLVESSTDNRHLGFGTQLLIAVQKINWRHHRMPHSTKCFVAFWLMKNCKQYFHQTELHDCVNLNLSIWLCIRHVLIFWEASTNHTPSVFNIYPVEWKPSSTLQKGHFKAGKASDRRVSVTIVRLTTTGLGGGRGRRNSPSDQMVPYAWQQWGNNGGV